MTGRRRYWPHRRAYAPRFWPMALASCAINVAFVNVVAFRPVWLLVPACCAIGFVVPWARLAFWRWRHPIITHGQYINDKRRAAPWN
jgi:uncharacterized membrane protein (DUF485 family)